MTAAAHLTAVAEPARRVAIYSRISDDREKSGLGVQRQNDTCREECARYGWEVALLPNGRQAIFEDNDLSASSGKRRPAYEDLMELLRRGVIDTVVVYAVDRLYRRVVELEALLDLLKDRPNVKVVAATGSNLDLGSTDGQAMARIFVSLAQREVAMLQFRTQRKHEELALAGKPSGGARPFGYTSDQREVVEEEAVVIREMAQRLIATSNVHAVARWLQSADVKTARGNPWQVQTVRGLLTNPRLIGLRSHKGDLTKAVWPAILDEDTWKQVQSILTDPERRTTPGNQAKHLLMRLVTCGRCGMFLATQTRGRSDPGTFTYSCRKDTAAMVTGCGQLRMKGEWLDEWVTASALARLEADEELRSGLVKLASPVLAGPSMDDLLRKRETLLARWHEVGDMFTAGEVDRAEHNRMRNNITEDRKVVDAALARIEVASPAGALLAAGDLSKGWESRSQAERRALLRLLIDRIVVKPANHGRNRFDPDRVEIIWRE